MFTLLKSADYSYSKSQLITKSYLDMEGIDLFVKILSQWRRKDGRKEEGQEI
jgi:hypothetical protein